MEEKVLNYRIIIEKEEDKKGGTVYVAYCPTLGISDYGDSVEEVLESIKEGIELAVDIMAKEEQEIPIDKMDEQIITSAKIHIPSNTKLSLSE